MLNLSKDDHENLKRFIETILERYRKGEIDLSDAQLDLLEAFSLAATGNKNLTSYLKSKIVAGSTQ